MAPKPTFRPSAAGATLIAFIAVVFVLASLTTTVSAQCRCTGGTVIYSGANCYTSWPPSSSSNLGAIPISSTNYRIYCQIQGQCVQNNCWWNRVYYRGRYCYVNDYYMRTGCADRCAGISYCST